MLLREFTLDFNNLIFNTLLFYITFHYSCTSPEGFEGPRCQKLRQSFNGTGYALYRQLEQCEESQTSIEILASKLTQLILFHGPIADLELTDPTDFILLEMVDGVPRLRINHGTGEVNLELTGSGKK